MNNSELHQYEKFRRKEARRENLHLYLGMLTVIVVGFSSAPLFSVWSVIPAGVLLFWALGILRLGQLMAAQLEAVEQQVNELIASGMSEHDAMTKLGCDKYYYKPFWAIK